MFRASQCSSSGDRILLIHHLVWLVCVSDCLVCRSGGNCISLLTGIPSSHLHRLIIPDDVLIQFGLLMMSAVTLEARREMKYINTWKSASSLLLARIHTIFMCRWSWHLGVSITRKPVGLLEAYVGIVFLHTFSYSAMLCVRHFGRASETFVEFYKTTRRHNPEDGILPIHRRENSNCLWSRYRHYAMGWKVCVSNLARAGE